MTHAGEMSRFRLLAGAIAGIMLIVAIVLVILEVPVAARRGSGEARVRILRADLTHLTTEVAAVRSRTATDGQEAAEATANGELLGAAVAKDAAAVERLQAQLKGIRAEIVAISG